MFGIEMEKGYSPVLDLPFAYGKRLQEVSHYDSPRTPPQEYLHFSRNDFHQSRARQFLRG
jgi:hypothetical protein